MSKIETVHAGGFVRGKHAPRVRFSQIESYYYFQIGDWPEFQLFLDSEESMISIKNNVLWAFEKWQRERRKSNDSKSST